MKKLSLLILFLFLCPYLAHAATANVQTNSEGAGSLSATTIAVTISAVGNNNTVAGCVTWGSGTTSTLTSVTDNQSNTYTIQRRLVDGTNGQSFASFYKEGITNGPVTITATFNASMAYRGMTIHEISGAAISAALGQETGQLETPTTAANNHNTTAVTTATNGEYIFSCSANTGALNSGGASEFTAGSSPNAFTEPTNAEHSVTDEVSISSEYFIQSAAGSIDATWTVGQATAHIAFIMTFKESGGASAARPRNPILFQ